MATTTAASDALTASSKQPLPDGCTPVWEMSGCSVAATAAAATPLTAETKDNAADNNRVVKAKVKAVLEKFNSAMTRSRAINCDQTDAIYATMQQEMAVLFLQHGGQVMQYMWGLNGDMTYDVVGDLNDGASGHTTSVKAVMEGVIDCMIKTRRMGRNNLVGVSPAGGLEYPAEVRRCLLLLNSWIASTCLFTGYRTGGVDGHR